MNNLREIKKSRLLEDESFTYMISSDERTNSIGADAGNLTNFYDIKFGSFSEPYDNYKVEVISFAAVSGFPAAAQNYYFFTVENLTDNGYFCSNKVLPTNDAILCILPLNALQDAYIQSDGGNVVFTVKNCRIAKMVRFKWLKNDFSTPTTTVDINVGAGIETRWVLTLRMTPIVDY